MSQTIEIDASTVAQAASLLDACRQRDLKLTVAESCTGGLLAATLTALPGSSDVFDRGFVPYSDEAKSDMLGVSPALIDRHGAVSEEVARAMVEVNSPGRLFQSLKTALRLRQFTGTEVFGTHYQIEELTALILRKMKGRGRGRGGIGWVGGVRSTGPVFHG